MKTAEQRERIWGQQRLRDAPFVITLGVHQLFQPGLAPPGTERHRTWSVSTEYKCGDTLVLWPPVILVS